MMNKKKLYCSIALNYDHFTDDEMEEKEIERGRKEITIIPLPIKILRYTTQNYLRWTALRRLAAQTLSGRGMSRDADLLGSLIERSASRKKDAVIYDMTIFFCISTRWFSPRGKKLVTRTFSPRF